MLGPMPMTEADLRGRIRKLIEAGVLPKDPPVIQRAGAIAASGLKISVALRYVLSFPWTPDAWREVPQHISWLLAEQDRIRKAGWFN
ncbi:MAG TPA: hypothetical protein VGA23_02035 [Methylomirabilota bacterium]